MNVKMRPIPDLSELQFERFPLGRLLLPLDETLPNNILEQIGTKSAKGH